MMRAIDACAQTNRWRTQAGPLALLCGGLLAVALLAPPLAAGPLTFAAATATAVLGARVPARLFFQALLVPVGFLLVGAPALAVSLGVVDGSWTIGVDAAGAWLALAVTLRAAGALAVTLCFACTVPTASWIALLRRAHVPEALLDLLMLVYRMMFVLDEARLAIVRAQDNRLGFRTARVALRSTARAAAALVLRSLQRAMRSEQGLAARGYTDRLPVLPPPMAAGLPAYAAAAAVPPLLGALAFAMAA
jgi:cobalt/nickel transport system permease protein